MIARLLIVALLAHVNKSPEQPASYYYDRPLTEKDLGGRSLRELTLMRNTIFARAGQPFRKRWIHEYFEAQPWYKAKAVVKPSSLSPVDQANADLLSRYEIGIPRAELEKRLQAILDRHRSVVDEELTASAMVAFTRDGREALVTDGHWVRLVDASTGAAKGASPSGGSDGTFGLIPEARTALFVNEGGGIGTLALANGKSGAKPVHETMLPGDAGWMRRLAFSADGQRLIAGPGWTHVDGDEGEEKEPVAEETNVVIVDIASGKVLFKQAVDDPSLSCLAFTPDGKRAMFASRKSMHLVDVSAGKIIWQKPLPAKGCHSLAVFPDGKQVVAFGSGGGTTWDLETGKAAAGFKTTLLGAVGAVAPDGRQLLIGGKTPKGGDTLELWSVDPSQRLHVFPITDQVFAVAWSPDGRRALTASAHGRTLWEVEAGKAIPTFTGHEAWWSKDERIEAVLLSRALGRKLDQFAYLDVDRTPLDAPELLDELVPTATLDGMSRRDLRIVRNMVYARRGRPFRSPLLRAYFERLDWYKADPAYTDVRLTAIDHRNIKLVQSAEIAAGGPLNDAGQKQEEEIPEA
jgi:hypothetical protein